MVVGRDGAELLQLRVDLGLMQMFPDGRPDGSRYHGLSGVLEYARHEMRLGREISAEDWREFERELYQINYRRLALASLAEEALGRNDIESAKAHLYRARRDIDTCLEHTEFAEDCGGDVLNAGSMALRPTLVFHRGRLSAQLRIAEQRYEDAVEEAATAADDLSAMLEELGLDDDQRAEDPGVLFLRDLEHRLRREYDIPATLRERLAAAIEAEDFETAASLRDELNKRQNQCTAEATNADLS